MAIRKGNTELKTAARAFQLDIRKPLSSDRDRIALESTDQDANPL